jgi:putative membrane protein insertion efficiency factor/ribonuclease P protein component
MLSRTYRLTERRDFATVYNRRRMAHTEHLTIYWMQDKRGHRRRFGFVTSKKVGKAHDRNLVRRRLRHICAACIESFIPGDYIFVARPGSPELSQDALALELFSAREKLYARIPKEQPVPDPVEVVSHENSLSVDAASAIDETPIATVPSTPAGTDTDTQPVSLAVRTIRVYQIISRITPSTCRYYPSCSEFMAQAMLRYGTWQGLWMGLRRIARCHPFAKGGHDPVP